MKLFCRLTYFRLPRYAWWPAVIVPAVLFAFFNSCRPTVGRNAEVTFFIGSDLHFEQDADDSTAIINKKMARDMASLPGKRQPDTALKVPAPEFVVFTGDITDHGGEGEWKAFTSIFGLNGQGAFPFLVYEGFGNHDGPSKDNPGNHVRNGIKARNSERSGIANVSENGLHYSWDRAGIHFVNLNSYPGNRWDPGCGWCHYFKGGYREPAFSLDFLKKDLKNSVGDSGRRVILFFHYGLSGWSNEWWTQKEQDAFHSVIRDYNIIAIFHGHEHVVNHYRWRNIPVWCVGSTQKSPKTGEYMVVHITDDQIKVTERKEGTWGKIYSVPLVPELKKKT